MSAAVTNIMPVTIPRFVSASVSSSEKQKGNENGGSNGSTQPSGTGAPHALGSALNLLQNQGGGDVAPGDPLDFDILAEYLLDDGTNAGGLMPGFDFSNENGGLATQSFADPLADAAQIHQTKIESQGAQAAPAPAASSIHPGGELLQVQQIIAAQAAVQQQQQQQQTAVVAPVAASVPVPLTGAIAAPPTIAAPPAPTAPVAISAQPSVPATITPGPMPPAPPAPTYRAVAAIPITVTAPAGTPLLSVHQHAQPQQIAVQAVAPAPAKRQRVEPATPTTIATTPVGAVMTLNGQLIHSALPQRGGRQKTQAQIDRRRERNRILARRTRLRKKFFFESLQKDVTDLQRENSVLKGIVRNRLNPEIAKAVLDDCTANEQLPSVVAEHCGQHGSDLDQRDFSLVQSIQKSQKCFVISDPSLQDNPIVYASEDFLTLTGYSRDEVLGRNCRFLQGTETSTEKVSSIRKAIESGEDCTVTLINYTADGTAFWNKLFVAALRDAQNNIVNFIGVIVKVAAPEPGDPEAGKILPGDGNDGPSSVGQDGGIVSDSSPTEPEDGLAATDTIKTEEVADSTTTTMVATEPNEP